MSILYTGLRKILSYAVELYYVDVQSIGRELIPEDGPVIFAANHPNSIMDTVVLGTQNDREISYMAKSGLFKNPAVAWLFNQCGVIPVYKKTGPGKTNDDSFRRAYEVLENGGTIGIFPEGRNSGEREMYEIKTGTSRIALGAESKNNYELGIRIVPVGLNFENRDQFLTSVLVRFGEPINVSDYRAEHLADDRAAVRSLTDEIQTRIQQLATHIEGERNVELVQDILKIYGRDLLIAIEERRKTERTTTSVDFDSLREVDFDFGGIEEDILKTKDPRGLRNWLFDEIKQTRKKSDLDDHFFLKERVADALQHYEQAHPELVDEMKIEVWKYKDHLRQVHLKHNFATRDPETLSFRKEAFRFTTYMLAGAIPAAWGFVHNALPYFLTWSFSIRAPDEAQRAIRGLSLGAVAYPLLYAPFLYLIWAVSQRWWVVLIYGISMPIFGFFFLRYRRQLARYRGRILTRTLFQTERHLLTSLQAEREELIASFDFLRQDFLASEEAGLVSPRLGTTSVVEEEE